MLPVLGAAGGGGAPGRGAVRARGGARALVLRAVRGARAGPRRAPAPRAPRARACARRAHTDPLDRLVSSECARLTVIVLR